MSDVRYEQDGPVTIITLDRPERMNAIGPQTHAELVDAWTTFRHDDTAHVAVLTGAGDRAFCAGGDLKAAVAGELIDPSDAAELAAHDRGERSGVLGALRGDKEAAVRGFGLPLADGLRIEAQILHTPEIREGLRRSG